LSDHSRASTEIFQNKVLPLWSAAGRTILSPLISALAVRRRFSARARSNPFGPKGNAAVYHA